MKQSPAVVIGMSIAYFFSFLGLLPVILFSSPQVKFGHQEVRDIQEFYLDNGIVILSLWIKDGIILHQHIQAKEDWMAAHNISFVQLRTDADFGLDLTWTGWRAPGKRDNAANPVRLTKSDFVFKEYRLYPLAGRGGLELEFLFNGKGNSLEMKLLYQLEEDVFFLRRKIDARNPFIEPQVLRVELSEDLGLSREADSLVVEQLYPVRWIYLGLKKFGSELEIPLSGYETILLEIYPLCEATRPLLAGRVHQLKKKDEKSFELISYPGESEARFLNPDIIKTVSIQEEKLDPAGMAIILEYLVKSREKLSRLKKNLPQYFMVKEKVGVSFREGRLILSKLEGEFSGGKRDFRDGLRVEFPDYCRSQGQRTGLENNQPDKGDTLNGINYSKISF
ncbi:MAG: hypothetical protein ACOC57_05390 [Acidobacteriota bacterium]